jgi:transcriptional regulator with XRE-family HTH domain
MTSTNHNNIHLEIGARIREIRTELGLSIRDLADKVGISYLTMQRIETDKISPSVVLLAHIAGCLNYPITDLLTEERRVVIHVKAEQQNVVDTKKILLKLVAPRGIVDKNISIVHGKATKGKFVGKHRHPGFELAYVLKGKALYKRGADTRELNEGDLIFWDADEWHEVIALEPHEWFGIQFYSDTLNLREGFMLPESTDPHDERPRQADLPAHRPTGKKQTLERRRI